MSTENKEMIAGSDKKKIYRLRDVSYMSLSVNYIFLLIFLFVALVGSTGYFLLSSQYLILLISIPGLLFLCYFVYTTGIKYGEYGLEIMISKIFMKKKFVNDFPILKKNLLNTPILKQGNRTDKIEKTND